MFHVSEGLRYIKQIFFANICTLSFYSFESYRGIEDCILLGILDFRIAL